MPAPFSCGNVVSMKKTIAAAALTALALAAPVAAQAAPECTYKVPKKMRLAPALRQGIPVDVTCAGPTEASLTFTEVGTQSLRVEIVPKKFFRHYAKTKLRILLGIKMEPDEPYHTSVDSGKVITLIR
jgi:hypothetical protein